MARGGRGAAAAAWAAVAAAAVVRGRGALLLARAASKMGRDGGGLLSKRKSLGEAVERLARAVDEGRNGLASWLVSGGEEVVIDVEALRPPPNHREPYDVIIVGAGASGVSAAPWRGRSRSPLPPSSPPPAATIA